LRKTGVYEEFMAATHIDLSKADDPRDAVHRAVEALAHGHLVVFPTETVYGVAANALDPQAVRKLRELKGRPEDGTFALAIKSADSALDYVPDMSPLAARLARRCWPGPITLVLPDRHPDSVLRQLPAEVQSSVSKHGAVGLRVPAHSILLSVLRLSSGPLVLTSANLSGQPDSTTAAAAMEACGDRVAPVLDDGPAKYAQPSSVVRVEQNSLTMLREGVINETTLRRFANLMLVMVCTGNTCRSPMAALMMRQRIAERLGCRPDELESRGVMVLSAGIAAMSGSGASYEAVQTMQARGLNLSDHESQPLSERIVRFADLILTMTRGHREAICTQWPECGPRVKLLCHDQQDVSDPIGGPDTVYQRCADQIEAQLDAWIDSLDLSGLIEPPTTGD
jgi:protein-tyrosine phosphatase